MRSLILYESGFSKSGKAFLSSLPGDLQGISNRGPTYAPFAEQINLGLQNRADRFYGLFRRQQGIQQLLV
jgi:hypothetical protein